ncbi:MAG: hypothetical protein D6757_07830 [Alphaproteobacteria bacterium]|nr:MAG: hypothetical protein D6757_07830 [Alphaproteobacteria bacterium]
MNVFPPYRRSWFPVLGLALLLSCAWPGAPVAAELLIVAHRSTPVTRLDPHELARIFLLKKTRWPDGRPIVPVNRQADSRTRQWFSRRVLGSSVRALTGYWNRMQFRGRMPPVVQESDRAVLGFVSHVPGAIGYVLGERHDLPPEVRVVARIPIEDKEDGRGASSRWPDRLFVARHPILEPGR